MTLGEFREKTADLPDDLKLVILTDPQGGAFEEVAGRNMAEGQYDRTMGSFIPIEDLSDSGVDRSEVNALRID